MTSLGMTFNYKVMIGILVDIVTVTVRSLPTLIVDSPDKCT